MWGIYPILISGACWRSSSSRRLWASRSSARLPEPWGISKTGASLWWRKRFVKTRRIPLFKCYILKWGVYNSFFTKTCRKHISKLEDDWIDHFASSWSTCNCDRETWRKFKAANLGGQKKQNETLTYMFYLQTSIAAAGNVHQQNLWNTFYRFWNFRNSKRCQTSDIEQTWYFWNLFARMNTL